MINFGEIPDIQRKGNDILLYGILVGYIELNQFILNPNYMIEYVDGYVYKLEKILSEAKERGLEIIFRGSIQYESTYRKLDNKLNEELYNKLSYSLVSELINNTFVYEDMEIEYLKQEKKSYPNLHRLMIIENRNRIIDDIL